jgi:LysM repeat protein
MAGVAAALCLSPPAAPAPAPAAATAARGPVVLAGAVETGAPAALLRRSQLTRATTAAAASARNSAAGLPTFYRVRRGDSLSSIAGHFYHDQAAWPVLYWRNHREIRWADDIYTGQVLRIPERPARIPRAPDVLRRPTPHRARHPAHARREPARSRRSAERDDRIYTGWVPGGAFGRCVVQRESSRRPQVMNSTGHYGLYQFSKPTWEEYGGKPSEFGHATVAEQNRVFATALADHGERNWTPYDHC